MGHMADGGYVDNEVIECAVDWIGKLIVFVAQSQMAPSPFDRVLMLRIRHQVPADPLRAADPDQKRHARDGFQFAAFGPLKTVLASEVPRRSSEVRSKLIFSKIFLQSFNHVMRASRSTPCILTSHVKTRISFPPELEALTARIRQVWKGLGQTENESIDSRS